MANLTQQYISGDELEKKRLIITSMIGWLFTAFQEQADEKSTA
jgi:hypothetical protein